MISKKLFVTFAVAAMMTLSIMAKSYAQEIEEYSSTEKTKQWDVQAGGSFDFNGKYIWRGQNLVDDPVIQPGAYLGIKGLTASIWGNYTITDDKEWTELDYALDYTASLGLVDDRLEKVNVSVGYIYYDFPNLPSGDKSQEVYAGVAVATLLSPSLTVYHDYDQGDGTYYEISAEQSFPLDPLTLNLSATAGYNDGQWELDSSFSSALLGASLMFPLGERVAFKPGIFYSVALDSQYENELYAGFSIGIEFWN